MTQMIPKSRSRKVNGYVKAMLALEAVRKKRDDRYDRYVRARSRARSAGRGGRDGVAGADRRAVQRGAVDRWRDSDDRRVQGVWAEVRGPGPQDSDVDTTGKTHRTVGQRRGVNAGNSLDGLSVERARSGGGLRTDPTMASRSLLRGLARYHLNEFAQGFDLRTRADARAQWLILGCDVLDCLLVLPP